MLPGERLVGGLTCSQVLAELSAYLDGDLDAVRKAAVEMHVSDCQNCSRFGAGFAAMLRDVRAHLHEPEPLPADVAARLHAAVTRTP